MKTILKILSVILFLNLSTLVVPEKTSAQVAVNFQLFYDNLSPYGTWVNYPEYGYAWIPSVGGGFSPYYTGGHWVFTDAGWMWVSDYPWGWAPFHYGRWYFDPMYGWMWIPGNEWAPAWVVWSSSPGYYGWAPLAPGVNINVVLNGGYRIPPDRWVFVPSRYIASSDISHYYGPRADNTTIMQKSTIIRNTQVDNSTHVTYVAGPPRTEVEKVAGKNLTPVAVRAADKPGQNVNGNEVRVYRPTVEKEVSNGNKPAPQKVAELKDVKPMKEQNSEVPNKQTAPIEHKQQPQPAPKKGVEKNPVPKEDQNPKKNQEPQDQQPKTMRQPVQHQYDYALNQEKQTQSNNQSSVKREQPQAEKKQPVNAKPNRPAEKPKATNPSQQNVTSKQYAQPQPKDQHVISNQSQQMPPTEQQQQVPERKKKPKE